MMKTIFFIVFFSMLGKLSAQVEKDSVIFYFDHNSSILKLSEKQQDQIVFLRSLNLQSIEVYAYADTLGSNEYNYWLAQRRAQRIIDLLQDVPVQPLITVSGSTSSFGEVDKNRRVSLRYAYIVPTIAINQEPDSIQVSPTPNDSINRHEIEKEAENSQVEMPHEVMVLNISFAPGKDVIKARSRHKVRRLIKKVKRENYARIELHGHVCCGDNFLLSKNRAQAIQWELEKAGMDHRKIFSYGHSNREPLVPEVDKKSQRKNRRVEVLLFK